MASIPPSFSFQGTFTVLIPCTEQRNGVTYYGIQLPDFSSSSSSFTTAAPSSPTKPSFSNTALSSSISRDSIVSSRSTCFRRYSEFAQLHQHLTRLFPTWKDYPPFPPKTWSKSPGLKIIQSRQKELANYLTCIVNHPELRSTSLVKEFLQWPLNPSLVSTNSGGSWSDKYRELHQALVHWKQHLNACDVSSLQGMRKYQQGQHQMQNEWEKVKALKKELETLNITSMEKTRRTNLLANLQREFQPTFPSSSFSTTTNVSTKPSPTPSTTFTSTSSSSTTPPHFSTTTPSAFTSPKKKSPAVPATVMEQHKVMESQDRLAEDLAQVIQRQKQVALQMNESLQEHTSMLDEMKVNMMRMDRKVDVASKQTKPFT